MEGGHQGQVVVERRREGQDEGWRTSDAGGGIMSVLKDCSCPNFKGVGNIRLKEERVTE
jgi:hypothetical protein